MKPIVSTREAVAGIRDGSSIMLGGFMCCGQPLKLVDALLEGNAKNLTLISNDAGFPDKGIGKLIVAGRAARLIASHIGLNPVAGQKMHSGEMIVELTPQGTLAEKIRCAGAGLGGILTPTGIGTEIEKGKEKIQLDGKDYLLERPIKADYAMIKVNVCDRYGNAFIAKSAKNFNVVMAMAAEHTIAEADEIVDFLDPDKITIPGVFVHAIAEAKI